MVLVRRDGGELRLREDEGLELLRPLVGSVGVGVVVVGAPDEVEPGLVAVHRVEYHVAVVVQLVVRQLQLVEGHDLIGNRIFGHAVIKSNFGEIASSICGSIP